MSKCEPSGLKRIRDSARSGGLSKRSETTSGDSSAGFSADRSVEGPAAAERCLSSWADAAKTASRNKDTTASRWRKWTRAAQEESITLLSITAASNEASGKAKVRRTCELSGHKADSARAHWTVSRTGRTWRSAAGGAAFGRGDDGIRGQ